MSGNIIRPLACAFGVPNEVMMSSSLENENSRRKTSRSSLVHFDIARKLKQSFTSSDDSDSVFKFGKPARHRGKKKSTSKKQPNPISSSSASGAGTRACYRFPTQRRHSKKFPSRKRNSFKDSRDDFVLSSSSSSSYCLTDSSDTEGSRDTSVESKIAVRDRYEVAETEPRLLHVQDCYEEHDALVLQLHIPPPQIHSAETLEVEYLPFKIPVLKTGIA